MKSCFLTVISLYCSICLHGQLTFNKAYDLGNSTLLESVWETNTEFILTGWGRNDSNEYRSLLLKINQGGVLNNYSEFIDSIRYWQMSWDVNAQISNSVSVVSALSWENDIQYATLFWFDETGDTLQTRKYYSPYMSLGGEDADWMRPAALDVDVEGFIYMTSQVVHPNNFTDFIIYKLTQWGDVVWTYPVSQPGSQLCYDIKAVEDGVIIAASGVLAEGRIFRKLNVDGVEDWTFTVSTNPITSTTKEMVIETDGIVHCTEHGNAANILPAILKTDYLGVVQWAVYMDGYPYALQYCYHIVKSPNGGYLAAAWQYEETPENPEANGEYNWNAWLIKVSDDGEVEWERFYHYIASVEDKHRVYDLKATSDGGYIFCGDAIDEDLENNGNNGAVIQWGWVVKVDACGCLVPGCDPDCIYPGVGESTAKAKEQYFVCGPNPATDFVNVYMRQAPEGAMMYIHDMAGRELSRFSAGRTGVTHMASTRQWARGAVVVSLSAEGHILQSEKVVVE